MRNNRWLIHSAGAALLLGVTGCPSPAPPNGDDIIEGPATAELQTVASGLIAPIYLTHAGDNTGRLFVLDQVGVIRVIQNNQLAGAAFLDIRDRVIELNPIYDERGLLGLAFHPGFADPGSPGFRRFYTYQSEPAAGTADFTVSLPPGNSFDHQNVLTEWQVSADNAAVVDLASARDIFRSDHPQLNHNGGQIAFGADGFLYIGIGDGGAANDLGPGHSPQGNGQDTGNLLGKILRIDPLPPNLTGNTVGAVSANGQYRIPADNPFVGGGGLPEIFAYGLRNPYRFSFDPDTDELIAGDVGQNFIEEVDIVVSGGNYGWPLKEGSFPFQRDTALIVPVPVDLPPGLIDPVVQFDHDSGIAVVGGFVYRGTALPELAGQYVFGSLSRDPFIPSGRIFYANLDEDEIHELIIGEDNRELGLFVKGFGVDPQGELYVMGGLTAGPGVADGVVLKIVPVGQ